MRILILQDDFPPLSFGGAGIATLNLAKAMKKLGHNVLVVTTVQEKENEGSEEYEGLRVYRMYSKYPSRFRAYLSLYNPQVVNKLRKIISDFKPDVVHAHNIHAHLSYHSLKLANESGARVFLTAHDSMLVHYGKVVDDSDVSWWHQILKYKWRYNPLRNVIIKYYLRYTHGIFAVSESLKKLLTSRGIKNVLVIHNGIDVEEWQVSEKIVEDLKTKYSLHRKKVVLFGGRLSEAKGGKQAVEAMGLVVKALPEAVLLVMGERNKFAEKMLEIAEQRGVKDKLVFTGWVQGEELKAVYHLSDVVIMPSIYKEPFGLVCLEAMASRKSVVATSFGGTPEIVKDGETGYIVNPLDVEEMADKIVDLLMNRERAEQFGQAGANRLKEKFNLVDKAEEYITLYKIQV